MYQKYFHESMNVFLLIVIDLIFLKIIHLKEAKLANHFNEIKLRLEMAYF